MSEKPGVTVLCINHDTDLGALVEVILGHERGDKIIKCQIDYQQIKLATEHESIDLVLLDTSANEFISNRQKIFEFCKQLKIIPALKDTPVILWRIVNPMSVYPEAKQRGIAGCIEYIFQPRELLEARDTVLSGSTYYLPIK